LATRQTPESHQFRDHICSLPLLLFESFKMATFLNPYRNFINVSTKDGQMLLSNDINKFESPLDGENKISL
jgi:hypothetical protein